MTEPAAPLSESAADGADPSPSERYTRLLPCPFCGRELTARWDGANPRAKCDTPDCMGGRLPVVNLDVPGDIASWNTRDGQDSLGVMKDLSMLVVRLAKHLSRSAPDSDLPGKAMSFLKRKNLSGNLLRQDAEGG